MKKRALMALPKLTATDEMKQIAACQEKKKPPMDMFGRCVSIMPT